MKSLTQITKAQPWLWVVIGSVFLVLAFFMPSDFMACSSLFGNYSCSWAEGRFLAIQMILIAFGVYLCMFALNTPKLKPWQNILIRVAATIVITFCAYIYVVMMNFSLLRPS